MRRLARRLMYLSAILWTVALLSPLVTTAWAEVDGNCEATIKGVDVRGRSSTSASDAIDVDDNEVVAVAMSTTSADGFASHKIDLEIAGVRRTVSSKTDDGDTQWSGSVNVKDYAWAGAGLYTVIGSATLSDGSSCSGAALIKVKRNPLTTVMGGVAAAATFVGGVAVVGSGATSGMEGVRASRSIRKQMKKLEKAGGEGEMEGAGPAASTYEGLRRETPVVKDESGRPVLTVFEDYWTGPVLRLRGWGSCFVMALPALLLTGAAMVTGGGQPPAPEPGLRLPRAPWRPRITVAGLLGGLLGGAGIVVLLQQYAVTPLTRSLAIEGLVIGLVVGLVVPSLVRVWSVMHVNGAIGKAERRLNEALAQAGPPAEPQP